MINKKKHLTFEERFFIEKMIKMNSNLSSIANALNRGLSTVSQEISTNGGQKKYIASTAQNRAHMKQMGKKRLLNKVMQNPDIRRFVDKAFKKGLKAEAISKSIMNKGIYPKVSSKSIRKYISQK